jgi:RES domain-containing protein
LPLAIPFEGVCFRNVRQKFATPQQILSAEGSFLKGGRYNFRETFAVLYLSCDIHTCLEETTQSFRVHGLEVAEALPRTVVGIQVRLSQVLDLTNPRIRHRLGVTKRELVETDWKSFQSLGQEALTQQLGRFARDAGFEALLVPSAALPRTGKNLDIFPDCLLPTSSLHAMNVGLLTL